MRLTGFADEASRDLVARIKATKELSWNAISARMTGGHNIREMPETDFQQAVEKLNSDGIQISEFGSLIANWGKPEEAIDWDQRLSQLCRVRQAPRSPDEMIADRSRPPQKSIPIEIGPIFLNIPIPQASAETIRP